MTNVEVPADAPIRMLTAAISLAVLMLTAVTELAVAPLPVGKPDKVKSVRLAVVVL